MSNCEGKATLASAALNPERQHKKPPTNLSGQFDLRYNKTHVAWFDVCCWLVITPYCPARDVFTCNQLGFCYTNEIKHRLFLAFPGFHWPSVLNASVLAESSYPAIIQKQDQGLGTWCCYPAAWMGILEPISVMSKNLAHLTRHTKIPQPTSWARCWVSCFGFLQCCAEMDVDDWPACWHTCRLCSITLCI